MAKPKPDEAPGPDNEPGAAKPKKKKSKRLILVVLVVVAAAGGVGYKTLLKHAPAAAGQDGPTTTVAGPITEETSLTVNLRDGHYLEYTVAIQTNPGQSLKILVKYQPVILDILNSQAQTMTEAQLLAPGGPGLLKAGIVGALNRRWPGLVQAVYFEQFVMQ